ncbi:TPA: spermidine/putrescine ABC transporter permease [Candidatus Dependentiae bacterium]|nr:spermidine/putrescine ABC transporter permease [Candidatus Dependentiae bacterium]
MSIKKIFGQELPFFLGLPAFLWQLIFIYAPLILIVGLSFKSLSFEYFTTFLNSEYLLILLRSLVLGVGTASFALLLGYPVAYWIALCSGRFKSFLLFLLFLPFLTNILLHIYAWMLLLSRTGFLNQLLQYLHVTAAPLHFLNSASAVFAVMVYCYVPFIILPIYSDLEKFDIRMIEASADLGASSWQTFWRVIFPLSLPGVRSGLFLVLVPAFSEFIVPELIGGDRMVFAGGVVAHFTLHGEMISYGTAFTLLAALMLILVVSLLYWLISPRWWRSRAVYAPNMASIKRGK